MLAKETINSLNQEIRKYGMEVKTNTVRQHIAFLSKMGKAFKSIKGSDFEISILVSMESALGKIIDDLEDDRHKGKVSQSLINTIEDLIDLNSALVRGAKKDKDDSEDWSKRLRNYIKILRNLSVVVLIIASNEVSVGTLHKPKSEMIEFIDWSFKLNQ